jgi:hypothetical protein
MACYADRGVLYVSGGAGTSGQVVSGAAGTTGFAGTGGGAGTTGVAGSAGSAAGCDVNAIFTSHSCTVEGACHDRSGSAAGFDMATPGWEKTLVGRYPSTGGVPGLESMCGAAGMPYLVPGSQPAAGLFLSKLRDPSPCGAEMPTVSGPLTPGELECVQRWANALTASSASVPAGCDVKPLMGPTKYACTVAGACHDGSAFTAGGLDLATPGWEQRLIGRIPSGVNTSMCGGVKTPYLIAGSQPAAGLLLQKLTGTPPCGQQMPLLGGPMSQADLQCFQRWADALTAP